MFFSKKFRHVGTTIRVEIRFLLRLSLTATSFQVYMLKAFKQKKNESSKRRWYFQKSSGHSYKLFVVIIGEICEVYLRDRNKALIRLFTVSKTDVKKKIIKKFLVCIVWLLYEDENLYCNFTEMIHNLLINLYEIFMNLSFVGTITCCVCYLSNDYMQFGTYFSHRL